LVDLGLAIYVIPDENNSSPTSLGIEPLLEAIGANVTVQNSDLGGRVEFL
jgi:hypothetical protein